MAINFTATHAAPVQNHSLQLHIFDAGSIYFQQLNMSSWLLKKKKKSPIPAKLNVEKIYMAMYAPHAVIMLRWFIALS